MRAATRKSHRRRPYPAAAALSRTTQPVKNVPAVGNGNGTWPDTPLAGVSGRVKRCATMRATRLSRRRLKIAVDHERPRKNACADGRNLCRRNATTPCLWLQDALMRAQNSRISLVAQAPGESPFYVA